MIRTFLIFVGVIIASSPQAHIPLIGQVARFQPRTLAQSAAFTMVGHVDIPGESQRARYVLSWKSGQDYAVTINALPSSVAHNNTTGPHTLQLRRQSGQCLLRFNSHVAPCGPPALWAQAELVGNAEAFVRELVKQEFIAASDAPFQQSSVADANKSNPRLKIVLDENDGKPMAFYQSVPPFSQTELSGSLLPYVQYFQTHWNIHKLVQLIDGKVVQMVGDLVIPEDRRNQQRLQNFLSTRVQVTIGQQFLASFHRPAQKAPFQAADSAPLSKNTPDLNALKALLSVSGQGLIDALLLTH